MGMFHDLVHLFGRLGHDYDLPYDRPEKPCHTGDCWYDAHGHNCPHRCYDADQEAADCSLGHDCDLPHTQPDPDGYIVSDEEAATFMTAIKGRDRIDDLTDRVEMLYALCIDIRNEIRALTNTPTETDLLNMAAADKRIAERLKHRK